RLDLAVGAALAAGNDRAGMAHAPAWRGGDPGNEADHRLFHLAALDEVGGVFLGAAADLADHDDALGLGVLEEHLQHVDMFGALDRIAANADAGRLAKPHSGGLRHRFIGERAGARNDADLAAAVNMAGHDADLALPRGDDAGAV